MRDHPLLIPISDECIPADLGLFWKKQNKHRKMCFSHISAVFCENTNQRVYWKQWKSKYMIAIFLLPLFSTIFKQSFRSFYPDFVRFSPIKWWLITAHLNFNYCMIVWYLSVPHAKNQCLLIILDAPSQPSLQWGEYRSIYETLRMLQCLKWL